MPGALEAVDEVLADVDGGAAAATEAIKRLLAALTCQWWRLRGVGVRSHPACGQVPGRR